MSLRRSSSSIIPSTLVAALAIVWAWAAPAIADAPAPAWSIRSLAVPSNFVPGDESGDYFYEVTIANSGGASTDGNPLTLTDTLPSGLVVKDVELLLRASGALTDQAATFCETESAGEVQTVTCTVPTELPESKPALLEPGEQLRMIIHVSTPSSMPEGPLFNFARVQGGGAPSASITAENEASSVPAPSGFEDFRASLTGPEGLPSTQAASHPHQYITGFAVNTKATPAGSDAPFVPAGGDIKNIAVDLPPGLVGNPTSTVLCSPQQFNEFHSVEIGLKGFYTVNDCPNGSAVGTAVVQQVEGETGILPVPLYNLVPPKGMPAQFGFQVLGVPFYIDTALRTGGDYGVTASLRNVSEAKRVTAATVTLWGAPAEAAHDPQRGQCLNTLEQFPFSFGLCQAGLEPAPFFRLPTSCAAAQEIRMSFDTWNAPGVVTSASDTAPAPSGCDQLNFAPTFALQPQITAADSPTGLQVNLHLPQNESLGTLATADLRDAVVTLPEGLGVNPASAGGLAGCSPAQIEIDGPAPARCPDASKVGSVEVSTPLLDHPVKGAVYVATQGDNPFGSLIAIYIAAHDARSGVVLKLAGRVELDPVTGRIVTRFEDNPQLPFEDLRIDFFEGPRAPLRTPLACGRYTTTTGFKPWSAPESGPDSTPSSSFQVSGGPCPDGRLAPRFSAGVTTPIAGARSPFVMRLTRDDGSGEFASLVVSTPPGLTAKLKGVPYCPEPGIAQARARETPGGGAVEIAAPSCPPASRVGTATAGAGAGSSPFYASGGVYLAGPYKGAPLSLVAVIPAVAGPFDLGVVVDRVALRLHPETAQVTAEGDPFPSILFGIPLAVRDIRVNLDRPDFTVAPTNCEPLSVNALVRGVNGESAAAADRFQVGACKALGFAPSLFLKLQGGTKRSDNPVLKVVLKAKEGEANIRHFSLALPHSEFLAQEHIRTICTRVQYAADKCPPGSIYGKARVFSPLLDQPLEGAVYLRSSSNPLPDLVLALRGQIDIDAVGRVDSVNGGIRTTFRTVPDAPISKVMVEMRGGERGLLVNSRNLCLGVHRATVKAKAHNGRIHNFRPVLRDQCKGKRPKK